MTAAIPPPLPPSPPPPREVIPALLFQIKRYMLPKDDKWLRITKAFYIVYAALIVPLYFFGMSNKWATTVVYYVWRTSLFGMFSDDLPYGCYSPNQVGYGSKCLSVQHALEGGEYLDFHSSFFCFVVGGLISIRIVAFCFETLERGLGIDFLSRLIDKFLPPSNPPKT
jgi:hypothetical protein